MNKRAMTLDQIRTAGLDALERELGPMGMVRFLQQFETGSGDYSTDRHQWLDGQDVANIARDVHKQRKKV